MRVINIVDSVDQINYGIWNAATANAGLLAKKGIHSELWYPKKEFKIITDVTSVPLQALSYNDLLNSITARSLNHDRDIIITHGAWTYATRWGAWLRKKGFTWIYVPHGMLEPWPLQQKRIKKALYLHLFEKRLAKQANLIKAVSVPESTNLQAFFDRSLIRFIPNGVEVESIRSEFSTKPVPFRYLFLSRLHHKKNLIALATAWLQSDLNNNANYELLIAGPDQGELEKLQQLIARSTNMQYVGSVYGEKKMELFRECAFYVLPSFSEGLPTSLLEAMSYGLVPIITEGCNFPDVFSKKLGIKIDTGIKSIAEALNQTGSWELDQLKETGLRARNFIKDHYSLEAVTDMQIDLFTKLQAHSGKPGIKM